MNFLELNVIDPQGTQGFEPYSSAMKLEEKRDLWLHGTRSGQFTAVRKSKQVGALTVSDCVFLGKYEGNGVKDRSREAPFRRYDGKQVLFSLDGYFTRDMILFGDSIPRLFGPSRVLSDGYSVDLDLFSLDKIDEEYIFLGTYHRHFGHALVESLGRLWFLQELSLEQRFSQKFVFFGGWGDGGGPLEYILTTLGVPLSNIRILRADAIFKRLIIPSQSWFPWNDWSITTSDLFYRLLDDLSRCANREYAFSKGDRPKRLFLSRDGLASSGIGFNRRELNPKTAERVSEILRNFGYTKVCMEQLPVSEQIAMISSATHICGPAGSAQHLAGFAEHAKSQIILSQKDFWMGSTDVVFVWDSDVKLQYYFGSKIGAENIPDLVAPWDIDIPGFEQLISSC